MKKALFLLMALLPTQAFATDIRCSGKVNYVMDSPAHCNSNFAFQLAGTSGHWMCAPSANSNSILLSAHATKAVLDVYIDDDNGNITCSSLTNYNPVRYILLTNK